MIGGGEEDELEVELVDLGLAGSPSFRRACPAALAAAGRFRGTRRGRRAGRPWGGSARSASLLVGEVGVLVELGLEALDFLEMLDEGGAGVVALEVGDLVRLGRRGPATS